MAVPQAAEGGDYCILFRQQMSDEDTPARLLACCALDLPCSVPRLFCPRFLHSDHFVITIGSPKYVCMYLGTHFFHPEGSKTLYHSTHPSIQSNCGREYAGTWPRPPPPPPEEPPRNRFCNKNKNSPTHKQTEYFRHSQNKHERNKRKKTASTPCSQLLISEPFSAQAHMNFVRNKAW